MLEFADMVAPYQSVKLPARITVKKFLSPPEDTGKLAAISHSTLAHKVGQHVVWDSMPIKEGYTKYYTK